MSRRQCQILFLCFLQVSLAFGDECECARQNALIAQTAHDAVTDLEAELPRIDREMPALAEKHRNLVPDLRIAGENLARIQQKKTEHETIFLPYLMRMHDNVKELKNLLAKSTPETLSRIRGIVQLIKEQMNEQRSLDPAWEAFLSLESASPVELEMVLDSGLNAQLKSDQSLGKTFSHTGVVRGKVTLQSVVEILAQDVGELVAIHSRAFEMLGRISADLDVEIESERMLLTRITTEVQVLQAKYDLIFNEYDTLAKTLTRMTERKYLIPGELNVQRNKYYSAFGLYMNCRPSAATKCPNLPPITDGT